MKWTNHVLITGAAGYAVTGNIYSALVSAIGAITPDVIEGRPGEPGTARYDRWRRSHRRLSHWFLPYLSVLAGLLFEAWAGERTALTYYGICFLSGCLMHIVEDAFCGNIPSLNPHKKIGFRFFYVGSVIESMVSYLVTVIIVGAKII